MLNRKNARTRARIYANEQTQIARELLFYYFTRRTRANGRSEMHKLDWQIVSRAAGHRHCESH